MQYSDEDDFKQKVEDSFGDVSTADSNASAFLLYADYGLRKRLGKTNAAYYTLRGGVEFTANSERSIPNCSNCVSQDIAIDSGVYGVAGLGYNFTQRFAMEINLKPYFSGDIESAIQLGFFGPLNFA